MSNRNNNKYNLLISRTKIYIVIIAILLIIISIFQYRVIPVAIALFTAIVVYTNWSNKKRKSELSEQLKDLTFDVNNTAKTTLINSPFSLLMVETNGNIIWKSAKYVSEFENENTNINSALTDILKEIKMTIINSDKKEKGNIDINTVIDNKNYKILGSYVKSKKQVDQEYTTILYIIDNTEEVKLKEKYLNDNLCLGIIMIDNYEEVSQRLSGEERPLVIAQVEKMIYDWAAKYNGLIVKEEKDKFCCIMTQKGLNSAVEDKISILDEIKTIDVSDAIQPTLSIAFSNDGNTTLEKADSTKATIDIALGRGGDQAIIKIDDKFEFFGGRTQEVEKRTKVKARMVAQALKELILESDNIITMGHINGDMDSIGASMGIYRLAKSLGKDARVLVETRSTGIEKFIEEAKKDPEYSDCFIGKTEANEMITANTLLVVSDTNKKNYVEDPELLEKIKRVVVIDHHRRSTEYIEDALLTFHEVYASSASELVTEILEYSQMDINLREIEIEALYAGIMLDTKDFTFKTGVRTFEAAAYLRKCGVDIIKVKKWFQNDLETYQIISEIIAKSEIMNDNIAISIYDTDNPNANIIAAKAADELLTIGGITASFVLGRVGDKIYISGRSVGEINVQIILEKLGGGGHITLAGAQLENISLEDAKQELINRINEYFFELQN